jgi:hypothetical protein
MATRWVSVTGSRYYPFTKETWDSLPTDDQLEAIAKAVALLKVNMDQFPKDWGVVSGGAKGPDTWAAEYAEELGLELVVYEPEYKKYGRGAPLHRNTLIAQHADSCLVFWDGESHGTNDFIKKAYKRRRELYIVGPTGTPWAIFDEGYWAGIDGEPPRMDIPRG